MAEKEPRQVPYTKGLWENRAEGWVLPFRNRGERYEMNTDNTVIFLHGTGFTNVDHIFMAVTLDVENDHYEGIYVWRHSVDFFDDLVQDMIEKGFSVSEEATPNMDDLKRYEADTGHKDDVFDEVVAVAMAHLDEEWNFYDNEWH